MANKINGYDPAFACAAHYGSQPGMSLRTYVAIEAMKGLLSNPNSFKNIKSAVSASIEYADALIKALNEEPNETKS